MIRMDWKEIAKASTKEVLGGFKEEGLQIVKEQVIPGVKSAKDEFIADLKNEAKNSNSIWVKIRNNLISLAIDVVSKVLYTAFCKVVSNEVKA